MSEDKDIKQKIKELCVKLSDKSIRQIQSLQYTLDLEVENEKLRSELEEQKLRYEGLGESYSKRLKEIDKLKKENEELKKQNRKLQRNEQKLLSSCEKSQDRHKEIICSLKKQLSDLKDYELFYHHIKNHLNENQEVICKICGKNLQQIKKDFGGDENN